MTAHLAAHCSEGPPFFQLYKGLHDKRAADCNLDNLSVQDAVTIGVNFIQSLLAVAGIVAVVIIIVGGIMYITSAGNPAQTKKAKDLIMNAVIGLVAVSAVFAIVNFIVEQAFS